LRTNVVEFPLQKNNTITQVLARFITAKRTSLSPETVRRYEKFIGLWQDYLDRYGLLLLTPSEKIFWNKRCGSDTQITKIFGPGLLVRSAVPFLGEFVVRELGTQLPVLEYAGTVVRRLTKWLFEEGLVSPSETNILWWAGTRAREELVPAALALACVNIQYGIRYDLRGTFRASVYRLRSELCEVLPGCLRFAVKGRALDVELSKCVTELCRPGWVFTLKLYAKGLSWGLAGAENVNIFGWQNRIYYG